MTEAQMFSGDSHQEKQTLYERFGTLRPVKRPFSVLADAEDSSDNLKEWTAGRTGERLIIFRGESELERHHDYLQAHDVNVFSKELYRKDAVLTLPSGTKSLRFISRLVERDPENYPVVFRLLGEQLRRVSDSGLGLPSGNWLDQFAYQPASHTNEPHNAKIVFLPPYHSARETFNVMEQADQQLSDGTGLRSTTITRLKWEIQDGWDGNV